MKTPAMFRKKAFTEKRELSDPIRWRGKEIARIEAFSDAVFGFATTLLIVSLEVPRTYDALMESMSHFFSFAICFTILLMLWYNQNLFFRRFGLSDVTTIVLNCVLLFTCLFFVYPLKFIFSEFASASENMSMGQVQNIYYIYNAGFIGIFLVFGLLYRHAARMKETLELSDEEVFHTRSQMYNNLLIASVGLAPVLLAAMGNTFIKLAPLSYVLIWPVTELGSRLRRKGFKRRFEVPVEPEAEIPGEDKTVLKPE